MRRVQMALLVVVAIVLIWIGATRGSAAQAPGAGTGAGRFTLSLTPVSAGPSQGYYAILLDTQTGRMWSSAGTSTKIHEFAPLPGPMDPHRPATDKPEAAPQP